MSRIYKKFSLSWILTIGALIFTMMMVSACEKGGGGDTTETQGPIITEGPVTTQTPAATPSVPTVDLKLVRLDGTALEFAATPIPLSASIKATFSEAMDTKSVEGAASLLDSNSKSVAGTFSWSTDNTAMTFLPAVKLAPKSTFAFKISADALSAAAVPIAAVEQNFLAMTIGDVTGDGAIDFAVGAPGYKNKAGAVMLYSAKLDANNKISDQPITTIVGEGQGSFFGYAILIPGDLDEDGFADIVIGAPGHKNLDGAAYFFSGRNFSAQKMPLPTEVLAKDADAIITGELDWGYFGTSIGYLGDIDGDGFAEIIIGEPQMAKKVGTPKAYVFSGKKIATTKQMTTKDMLSTLTGDNNSGGLGTAIARAGDVNGDGQDEIMISAPGTLTATGQYVYIFKTNDFKNNVNVSNALCTISCNAGQRCGWSMSTAGDLDNDGKDDVIIGAPGEPDNDPYSKGNVYIHSGAKISTKLALSNVDRMYIKIGLNINDWFGYSVAGGVDIDGDGKKDIIIGTPGFMGANVAGAGSDGKGKVDYYSGAQLNGNPLWTLTGGSNKDAHGWTVSSLGDITGINAATIMLASPGYQSSKGAVFVLMPPFKQPQKVYLLGSADGDNFGQAIAVGIR